MPSRKWMEAEERIFNDPLYQDAQPRFVGWIEQLQRAKTADDLNDLQYEMVIEFGARQDAVQDFIPSKREEANAEHQRLLSIDPRPVAAMREQQVLLDRLELRDDVCSALQHSMRVIADGIVWRALDYDRTAIAVLGEGTRVGRFANEEGLQPELRRMDDLRERYGVLALHNDMTNCLRVGDVTGIFTTDDGQRLPVPVEVKKSEVLTMNSPQVKRITAAMHRIETRRLHLPLAYRTYMNDLPELIRRAKATGHATLRPAPCVFVEVCDFRHFGGRPEALGEQSRKVHKKLGWLDGSDLILTGQTARSRARDRHDTVSQLAPISIFPLPAEDVADILFGFVDVKVLLNVPLLQIAFARKGLYTEIHRAPESGRSFLTAQSDSSGIIVPAHLREQILHETMTPSTLIRMVEYILDSGLAAKWKAVGSAPGVGFADERRAWSRTAPVDVSSVRLVPAGFPSATA
jgi:hypothetical protein